MSHVSPLGVSMGRGGSKGGRQSPEKSCHGHALKYAAFDIVVPKSSYTHQKFIWRRGSGDRPLWGCAPTPIYCPILLVMACPFVLVRYGEIGHHRLDRRDDHPILAVRGWGRGTCPPPPPPVAHGSRCGVFLRSCLYCGWVWRGR